MSAFVVDVDTQTEKHQKLASFTWDFKTKSVPHFTTSYVEIMMLFTSGL